MLYSTTQYILCKSEEDALVVIEEEFNAHLSEGVSALGDPNDGFQLPYVHWRRLNVVDGLEISVTVIYFTSSVYVI